MKNDDVSCKSGNRKKDHKILLVIITLILLVILTLSGIAGYYVFLKYTTSLITISNLTNTSIRIDGIEINHKRLSNNKEVLRPVVFKSREKGERDFTRKVDIFSEYVHAPKAFVQMNIDITLLDGDKRTKATCILDNRRRPCFFEVLYTDNKLLCLDCDEFVLRD